MVVFRDMLSVRLTHLFARTTHQCKVDLDMLNAVKSVLADVSPSSEQRGDYGLEES